MYDQRAKLACSYLSAPSSSSWSSIWVSSLLCISPSPGLPTLCRKKNPDEEESFSSRSSSLSSLDCEILSPFIQAGQGWVTPREASTCDWVQGLDAWNDVSAGPRREQEHSGSGWERKDFGFDFVESCASPSTKAFLTCLRTDVIQVWLASYKWSRVSSKSLTTSLLQRKEQENTI